MRVSVESHAACNASVEALFDLISDTDRLNREAGLGRIEIDRSENGSSRKLIRSPVGPITLEYAERPFEWQRPERIHVQREYSNGPLRILDIDFKLAPRPKGSEVTIELRGEPRPLMGPVLKVVLTAIATKLARAIEKLDRELTSSSEPQRVVELNRTELERAERELSTLVEDGKREIAERLVRHVAEAPDQDLGRMRPFDLADRWKTSRNETLETFLYGVMAGLLELNWELICPSCRVGAATVPSLSDIEAHGHCSLCDLSFGVTLDQAVEATFFPSPAIRRVKEQRYCTGGPASTPHVIAQASLEPGSTVAFKAPEELARYRLFVRGGATIAVDLGADRPEEAAARIGDDIPAAIAVRPGGRIRLSDGSGVKGRHVKLEKIDWSNEAATAYSVAMLPAFRRQFSEQLLRPGLALKVARVAILFSDLSASTALYTREGDAAAFGLVHDHFDLLRACIEQQAGVIVKTIGDAVMAAFVEESSALKAAIEMQKAFPAFRASHPASEGVFLKIGLYAGSCYVVTANGVLDYFGQTVNVAARLQAQAHDAEIVVSEECSRGMQASLLESVELDPPFVAKLKGVNPDIRAVRMRVRA
jgi:adenylate cyclase